MPRYEWASRRWVAVESRGPFGADPVPAYVAWPALISWSTTGRTVYGPWEVSSRAYWARDVITVRAWDRAGGRLPDWQLAIRDTDLVAVDRWNGREGQPPTIIAGRDGWAAGDEQVARLATAMAPIAAGLERAVLFSPKREDTRRWLRGAFVASHRHETYGSLLAMATPHYRVATVAGRSPIWVARLDVPMSEVASLLGAE